MAMKQWRWAAVICLVFMLSLGGGVLIRGLTVEAAAVIKWENCLNQSFFWYRSEEAIRIADNVLLPEKYRWLAQNIDIEVLTS